MQLPAAAARGGVAAAAGSGEGAREPAAGRGPAARRDGDRRGLGDTARQLALRPLLTHCGGLGGRGGVCARLLHALMLNAGLQQEAVKGTEAVLWQSTLQHPRCCTTCISSQSSACVGAGGMMRNEGTGAVGASGDGSWHGRQGHDHRSWLASEEEEVPLAAGGGGGPNQGLLHRLRRGLRRHDDVLGVRLDRVLLALAAAAGSQREHYEARAQQQPHDRAHD